MGIGVTLAVMIDDGIKIMIERKRLNKFGDLWVSVRNILQTRIEVL